MTFILAMVRNPKVAKKAQEEIDRVMGHDRLPNWEDKGHLPYIDCILKETLRYALSPYNQVLVHALTRRENPL